MTHRFAFQAFPLTELQGEAMRLRRDVNPALARHSAWISAVGAAAALADLDGDGLDNDVCQVDPRTDRVILAPLPDTGPRYGIFAIEPVGLPYDRRTTAPMGCVPADLNEDGWLDLLVYYWGRTPVIFLRKPELPGPPGPESFVAREVTTSGERWYTNAASFADLDGDGHLDLLIGNYFQDGARVLDINATASDFMQDSMSRAYNGGRKHVFLWVAGGTAGRETFRFEEVEDVFDGQSLHGWTLAIGAVDLDRDLLPEVYFANDFGPDRLFHNRSRPGELRFARLEGERTVGMPRSKVVGQDSFKGMGVDFSDVNSDGYLDIFVSNIAAEYALQESHFLFLSSGEMARMSEGVAPYRDRSEDMGVSRSDWSWDAHFGDFDNDGVAELVQATGFLRGSVSRWPELQELATANDQLLRWPGSWPRFQVGDDLSGHAPNGFFVRASDGRYYDLARDVGLGATHVSRGIATGDVDADGDLDFVVANQWEPSVLYRNESAAPGAFLGLHLLLAPSSHPCPQLNVRRGHPDEATGARAAVGAAVRIQPPDGRVQLGFVDRGTGHAGVRSPAVHFGLGSTAAEADVQVAIDYRDRAGRSGRVEIAVKSGWHTIVLPDFTPPPTCGSARAQGVDP